MWPDPVLGTQGYPEQAGDLVKRYEAVSFIDKHQAVLHLLPRAPGMILDVGAGTGADAAWLASRGHRVVAVEPTKELRISGMALHPSRSIEWVDDSLPGLASVLARCERFDAVMLAAVWMHLDEAERRAAMPNLASLLEHGGVLVMSLRHGRVPAGRRMFHVSSAETISLAQDCGMRPLLETRTESIQDANREAGVTWTHLAFE
jgi:2-polyprenyl-3-methyl-5-hydroxy-6-metoxy-1,4-benzoquinol methylase